MWVSAAVVSETCDNGISMRPLTQDDGTVWIETRREGLLALVGHDLLLAVRRFRVQVAPSGDEVEAQLDASSVTLQSVLDGDREVPGGISARDRRRIERKVADEVLEVRRHPDIRFASTTVTETASGLSIEGALTIRGVERPVTLDVMQVSGRWRARCALRTSDFGIRPVTALLGTLKVQDVVQVFVDLPAPVTHDSQ